MTAAEILVELRERAVSLEATGGRLRLRARHGALTPHLRAAVAEQRDELLDLVSRRTSAVASAAIEENRRMTAFASPSQIGPRDQTGPTRIVGDTATTTGLTAFLTRLLAAHPGGILVTDQVALADYLASAIIHRFNHPNQAGGGERPLRRHKRDEAFWVARCPSGHLTNEAIENHQVLGWACEECQRVYDASECRLVPRPSALSASTKHVDSDLNDASTQR